MNSARSRRDNCSAGDSPKTFGSAKTRASAMTTATAFGALWLSSHPGTASMGRLLMISLGWELLVTLLFRPALLAQPPIRTIAATA